MTCQGQTIENSTKLSKSEYRRLRVQVPFAFQKQLVLGVLHALLMQARSSPERCITQEMLELFCSEPERLDGEPS